MKLKILFTLTLLVTLLAGCSATDDEGMTSDQTLAYSTYMAGAFLSGQSDTAHTPGSVTMLDSHTDDMLKFEEELSEVNHYFETFRVFIDNGMENPFDIEKDFDVEGDYDITMRYTVRGKTFTILLDEDDEGTLEGILVLDGVEYDVEGTRALDIDYEDDETTVEEREDEIYLKTIDKEDSDDFVELSIETEDEHDEYEFEMTLLSYIDGVERELEIEFSTEEDEVFISIESSNGNTFYFSREISDDEVDYEFEYTVDGVEGEVELTITTDDDGNRVYQFKIEENGETKEIERIQDDS